VKTYRVCALAIAAVWPAFRPCAAEDKLAPWVQRVNAVIEKGPFQPNWESLKAHQDPEWFRDAKFGIYTHWGPVTVGAENCPSEAEWYGRQMYLEEQAAFRHHRQLFGEQKSVGYKDVIPHFKAEKFDAEAWAELFAKAGAKFAGPVAVHHDNFANWDSQVTRWNSRAMGPRRDLLGELARAIRGHGMKFFTSFHHGFAWQYFQPAYKYDAADPQWADLYGEPHGPKDPPSQRYLDQWLAMVYEPVEKYQPDLIWFDFELCAVIPEEYRQKMFATVYNLAAGQRRQIGVAHKFREIQRWTGILDFERGREDKLTPYPWLTDTSIGPWFHHECMGYRPLGELVGVLVDIVSKNGCMLLNVGPRADGTIPEKAQAMLLGMGRWLAVNGEALYGTRPWLVFGEGPTRSRGGGFSEGNDKGFTAADIRFTAKGPTLYAIALGWPKDGKLLVRSLAADAGKVTSVSLLGHQGALVWSPSEQGLAVTLPAERPCEHAFVLKISARGPLKPSPVAQTAPAVQPATVATRANMMVEIAFTATQDYHDAFHDVVLDVLFETPQGRTLKVPAFWAGGRVWKVRYASPAVGTHRWRSVCCVPADRGLHGLTGTVTVEAYHGENPLYLHGPLRVAADRRHFEHLDGTPFFWLADTWWMGLCRRLHWPDEFQQLAADRKAKGFNVVQIVAGLYPDMPAFDRRGANEAGFPWEKDYTRIRPEYFDKADQRLLYLVDQGFVPCLVGAWGYHLPWLGAERMKQHWRYLIARYAALPVVWCAAGEGTMPFYGSKHANEEAAMQKEGWSEVIRSIRASDPFGRMITIHPSGSARATVTDPAILDFDMHQTGHMPEEQIGRMARQMRPAYETQPAMPVLAGESSYDGLDLREFGGGVLSSDASRQMFWVGLMHNGAAGGTYGANGIWQVNRRDAPYGPSPHGRSWGSTPWDEAMRRPGSAQVGLAKQFFSRFPWNRLEPQPDSVAWAGDQWAKDDIRPCALGIGATLRIVYVPRAREVLVMQLAPRADYTAAVFDPVTGRQSSLGNVTTDQKGTWRPPPPDCRHDWVVVLKRSGDSGN
jgi:alpha-L-fucosidase